ncbi:MAG: hypothetical protein RBU30_06595 [Polyangia bacterium]|nr:hypothetical protein [Polyangia bacterium]
MPTAIKMRKALLRIYSGLSPNYRRLRRLEDTLGRLAPELRKAWHETANVRPQLSKQQQRIDQLQRDVASLTLMTRTALTEVIQNRHQSNHSILERIIARGATIPTTLGKELTFYGPVAEDFLMESICAALAPERLRDRQLTYLDIGAGHPINGSNTYRFYRQGIRGVLLAPVPELAREMRRIRPADTVLEVGVRFDARTEAELFVTEDRGHWSFDPDYLRAHLEREHDDSRTIETLTVTLMDINEIIDEQLGGAAPGILNLAAEPYTREVLSSLDVKRHRPLVICIEHGDGSHSPSEGDGCSTRVTDLMRAARYTLVARTRGALIFTERRAMESALEA